MGTFEIGASSTGPCASSNRFCKPVRGGVSDCGDGELLAASIIFWVRRISCWAMKLAESISAAFRNSAMASSNLPASRSNWPRCTCDAAARKRVRSYEDRYCMSLGLSS